jgi:hypothetical protein
MEAGAEQVREGVERFGGILGQPVLEVPPHALHGIESGRRGGKEPEAPMRRNAKPGGTVEGGIVE